MIFISILNSPILIRYKRRRNIKKLIIYGRSSLFFVFGSRIYTNKIELADF